MGDFVRVHCRGGLISLIRLPKKEYFETSSNLSLERIDEAECIIFEARNSAGEDDKIGRVESGTLLGNHEVFRERIRREQSHIGHLKLRTDFDKLSGVGLHPPILMKFAWHPDSGGTTTCAMF